MIWVVLQGQQANSDLYDWVHVHVYIYKKQQIDNLTSKGGKREKLYTTTTLSAFWRWIANKFLFICIHESWLCSFGTSVAMSGDGLENSLFTTSVWGVCLVVIPGMQAVEGRLPCSTALLFHLRNALLFACSRGMSFTTSGTMISTFSLWSILRWYGVMCQYCLGVYPHLPLESYTTNSLMWLVVYGSKIHWSLIKSCCHNILALVIHSKFLCTIAFCIRGKY